MAYKFKKGIGQIFKKELPVPQEIKNAVYAEMLSFQDYIKYDLEKYEVPISCLRYNEKDIVEKFGIEKAKTIDWEYVQKASCENDLKSYVSASVEDINKELYKLAFERSSVGFRLTPNMQHYYPWLFEQDGVSAELKHKYYSGKLELAETLYNWEALKDKDLSESLSHDHNNKSIGITDEDLKKFAQEKTGLFNICTSLKWSHKEGIEDYYDLYAHNKETDVYKLIDATVKPELNDEKKQEEQKQSMTSFLKNYLHDKYEVRSNEHYQTALQYISLEECFPESEKWGAVLNIESAMKGNLDKIAQLPFSVAAFSGKNDLSYAVNELGVENIINFAQQHDNSIFNDAEMLKTLCDISVSTDMSVGSNKNLYNFINLVKEKMGDNSLNYLNDYGKYFAANHRAEGHGFGLEGDIENSELSSLLNEYLYQKMASADIMYDEKMPTEFKEKYSQLFLPDNAPDEIKQKFYSKEFKLSDFEQNPELLDNFKDTNISCAFSKNHAWTFGINKGEDINEKKLILLGECDKISESSLKKMFQKYFIENTDTIEKSNIEELTHICSNVSTIMARLENSNASEMQSFKNQIARQLLETKDPMRELEKIEEVFLKNNLPVAGKIYNVFQILHPDVFSGFDMESTKTISPVLKDNYERQGNVTARNFMISSDILKCAFGSNNRSLRDYLDSIEQGNQLLTQINSGDIDVEQLDNEDKEIVGQFVSHLGTLYNNSKKGKQDNENQLSGDIKTDIMKVTELFSENGKLDYDLPDRVISMFCRFAGVKTFEEAKNYFAEKPKQADQRNRQRVKNETKLEKGDLIKGFNAKFLSDILQNGVMAQEFLGASANSDYTPLDIDFSKIIELENNAQETIEKTAAREYGPPFIVLKKDDRFATTRVSPKEEAEGMEVDKKPDSNKYELFYLGHLGEGHYGIRSGIASTEIDYLLTKDYDQTMGLEIAKNGFYIPVLDYEGKVVFTEKDYDNLRSKMSGMSHYGTQEYEVEDSIFTPKIEATKEKVMEARADAEVKNKVICDTVSSAVETQGLSVTAVKNKAILSAVTSAIEKQGLTVTTTMKKDLSENIVQFINTGSTGRDTNLVGDSDFDFVMRVDKKIMMDNVKLSELRNSIAKALGREDVGNDFRFTDISLDGLTEPVDIDITFESKTDKLNYTTDMALLDRLNNIKKQSPDKYPNVLANIIKAKQLLKGAEVYKPKHASKNAQGGLGGVGVENWILQNGGSLEKAMNEFLKASNGKSFEEFKQGYHIWDFGENQLAERSGKYAHDNFVENMNEDGYNKMKDALEKLREQNIAKQSVRQSDTKPHDDEEVGK